jgi:biopolymer transport protein ExbB
MKRLISTVMAAVVMAVMAFASLTPVVATAQQPAAPAAAPAAAPSAPAPAAETVAPAENPYGLKALWNQGDAVAKVTLIILVIMSVGSWYIIVVKLLEQNKAMKYRKEADEQFWPAKSIRDGVAAMHEDSPFRYVAEQGLEGLAKHEGVRASIDLNTWVTMGVTRASNAISSKLQGGLSFLATVGSTAPFVGLFGTVWGIYHALVKIGVSGQASIDKVAGPVGEALIMTAIGLAVAVPAVLGYNWLVRRNKAVMEQVHDFSTELHAALLGQANK